jgi:ornithine cyclodeaminase/alanine dehydrogenase
MTLVLDSDEVRDSISMPGLIEALDAGLRSEGAGGVDTVPRVNLASSAGFFRVMPAVVSGMDVMGLKVFNGSTNDGVRYLIALYRASTGELLTLMDASYLTAARTGATTGLATRAMLGDSSFDEVGVIGSGLEARTNLEAVCAVLDVRRVRVFSPNPARRQAFATEMTERLGVEVTPVDAPEAAADAPVVIVATNTGVDTDVVALRGAWLRDDAHVNSIGSTMPALREIDGATFARAQSVVVDTDHVCVESGDVLAAIAAGEWADDKVRSLPEVLAAGAPVRNGAGLSVFKSVGTATQDVVAAAAVYEAASEAGRGREVRFLEPKLF